MHHERKYHLEDNGIAAMSAVFQSMRCYLFPSQQSGAGRWIYRDTAVDSSSHTEMKIRYTHHDVVEFVDQ